MVGVESKRFEPVRGKSAPSLSPAYWRPVWGDRMTDFERVRDGLRDGSLRLEHLDGAQLVKHAFGLRTAASRVGKRAALIYLHCEPQAWLDGRPIPATAHARHRQEVADLATPVAGDEVAFSPAHLGRDPVYLGVVGRRPGPRPRRGHAPAVRGLSRQSPAGDRFHGRKSHPRLATVLRAHALRHREREMASRTTGYRSGTGRARRTAPPPARHALYDLGDVEAALGGERHRFTGDPTEDEGLGIRHAALQAMLDAGETARWRTLAHATTSAPPRPPTPR